MGLSRCPRVAWQRQAQNLSMNMLAHTSKENHQSLLYFICYFSCILRLNPKPGHAVQVPYHWPIAPALHNSSSRYTGVGQWEKKRGLAAKPNDLSSIPREPTADIILWLPHVSQHVHIRNHRYMDKSTHTLQFGSEMSPAGSCFKCFIPSLQGSSEVCRTFRKWHLIGTVSSYFNVRLTHPRPARLSQVLPVWCHILLRYHP